MAAPARLPPGEKGTDLRTEADDGFYWVRLVTRGALDREGACMCHCVGDGDYDKYCGAEDLSDSAIWSLRRPDGVSVLTVQIVADQVDTVKGYRNHPPGRGAALQFRHLVAEWKAAGKSLVAWSGSGIVIAPDGRTFRSDRVPPDVQAAIEEAYRAARKTADGHGGAYLYFGADLSNVPHIIEARLEMGVMHIITSDGNMHRLEPPVIPSDLRAEEDEPRSILEPVRLTTRAPERVPASWSETEVRIAVGGTSGYPGGGGEGAGVATGSLGPMLRGGAGGYPGGGGGGSAGRPGRGGAGRLVFRILNDGSRP